MIRSTCPVCNEARVKELYRNYDDRYGFPDEFTIVECGGCGCGFIREMLSEQAEALLYNKYYPSASLTTKKIPIVRGVIRAFYEMIIRNEQLGLLIPWGAKVLDVGCGNGNTYYAVNLKKGDWTGLEIDERKRKALEAAGYPVVGGTLEQLADQSSLSYDAILASQVIEHVNDPYKFVKDCHNLLRTNGLLILSTPNFNSRYRIKHGIEWIHLHTPYHQILFTEKGLYKVAENTGFRVDKIRKVTPALWTIYQKKYHRPAKGTIGKWYQIMPKRSTILWNAIAYFIKDCLNVEHDCLVAVLRKDKG